MNNIHTFLVNPRSIFSDFISYDIAPEEFTVSVLETEMGGISTFTVLDSENQRIYVCAVENARKAVESYVNWMYGKVDVDGEIQLHWASDCIVITSIHDEWEIVKEE